MKTVAETNQSAGSVENRLLTKEEVAERLGIRPRTVALWANDGRLPVIRAGRRLRFRWADIERFFPSTCANDNEGRKL